jgi:hypothetical protein
MQFNIVDAILNSDISHNERMDYIRDIMPIRIQFTCYHILEAECIVQGTREAERICAAYANLKYKRNKPMGGACHYRADLPRTWNCAVGATITDECCSWNRK